MPSTEWTWAWPWWWSLVIINIINFTLCIIIFVRSVKSGDTENRTYLRTMRILGLIFCLVSAYRSVFVSRYLTQLAWFDTILNSTLLIRSLALFAELSFAGLIAISLIRFNRDIPDILNEKDSGFTRFIKTKTPYMFFICIFAAQFFVFSGVITKIRVFFAIEETLWGLAFLSITPLVLMQIRKVFSLKDERSRKEFVLFRAFTLVMAIFCVGYVIYSLGYHLPIEYWPSAIAQLQMEVPEPAIRLGAGAVRDAFFIVNVTRDLSAWGGIGFVIWHTGYFSICVWMVLLFMCGPRRLKARG